MNEVERLEKVYPEWKKWLATNMFANTHILVCLVDLLEEYLVNDRDIIPPIKIAAILNFLFSSHCNVKATIDGRVVA